MELRTITKHWKFKPKKIILIITVLTAIGSILQTCFLFPAASSPPNHNPRLNDGAMLHSESGRKVELATLPTRGVNVASSSTEDKTVFIMRPDLALSVESDDGSETLEEVTNEDADNDDEVQKKYSSVEETPNVTNSLGIDSARKLDRRHTTPVVRNEKRRALRRRRSRSRKSFPEEIRLASPQTKEEELSSMPPDEGLAYAKRQIMNAPLVTEDPELDPMLFHNVSVFKRSYGLMEKMLNVYIYQDGERPIFHTPELQGIYASEGWFMKLMEQDTQFAVDDPSRAHLFYLPYSSRQLQQALYVPNSHNMQPLAIYLRDYVNGIASKYPFWNRTRGADHFLVACHDWGPYTTKDHDELCHNTIKALCNADLSEGFFVRGKDVSLPETTVHIPRRPLRDLGGKRVSQRPILAFFAGYMHGRVRPVLLKHWGNNKDEDMKIYGPLPARVAKRMTYPQHMKSSKYCICPMGYEVNSPRIVEAIFYECVPVIIADNFVLPFDDILNWSAFSVVVAEKDIPRLKGILTAIPLRQYLVLQNNVKKVQKHFLWHINPVKYDLFYMLLHSLWFNRLNQIRFD